VDDVTVLAVSEVVYSELLWPPYVIGGAIIFLFNYVLFSDLGLYSVIRVGNRQDIYTAEDFREATPFRDVGNMRIVSKISIFAENQLPLSRDKSGLFFVR